MAIRRFPAVSARLVVNLSSNCPLERNRVCAHPVDEFSVAELAGCDRKNILDAFFVRSAKLMSVQIEKEFQHDEPDALVSIDERMILNDPERVRCRKYWNFRRWITVRGKIFRSG